MIENLEKDFKKQIEDYEFKQNQQRSINTIMEQELAVLEKSYQIKLAESYEDEGVLLLQQQVRQLEAETAVIDKDNEALEAELEDYSQQLADAGIHDLSELGDSLHKINAQMALLQQKIAEVERQKARQEVEQLKKQLQ